MTTREWKLNHKRIQNVFRYRMPIPFAIPSMQPLKEKRPREWVNEVWKEKKRSAWMLDFQWQIKMFYKTQFYQLLNSLTRTRRRPSSTSFSTWTQNELDLKWEPVMSFGRSLAARVMMFDIAWERCAISKSREFELFILVRLLNKFTAGNNLCAFSFILAAISRNRTLKWNWVFCFPPFAWQ